MGNQPPKQPESFAALFEGETARAPRRRSFAPGDQIDVTVVQIGRDAVFVELDGKQEGFIEAKDLSSKTGELAVKVGSRITAKIVEMGGRPGAARLVPLFVRPGDSGNPAIDELPEQGGVVETAEGPAIGVGAIVKGTVAMIERYGVFVDLGEAPKRGQGKRSLRGLVPNAELGLPRGADLHRALPVGTSVEAKVIAIDERGRIKLSVVALRADAERREFEAFEQKGRGPQGAVTNKSFGTLGDLLSKRK
jgi:small subunit ribosomal protein S1